MTTADNIIISGIPLEDLEIYPTHERRRWTARANIQTDRLIGNYVELWFSYESMYASELGEPENLRGRIVRRYRLSDGKPYPLE